jgi:nitroreductase
MDHVETVPLTGISNPIATRYGDASAAPPAQWNTVLDTLLAHRSVRAYLPDPVSPETLALIIAAAQSAATSSNLQVWSVVAVTDQQRKDRLSEMAGGQRHIREAPLFLVWLADLGRLAAMAEAQGVPAEALDYLEMLLVGVVDATLAAQNAVVALESLGLGSVYIGGIRNHPEQVAAELGLLSRVFPVFGLCVGTPDPQRPASVKPRLPQAAVLHHEHYDAAVQPPGIAAYDERLRDFQISQNLPPEDWTSRALSRVKGPGSLSGRDRMRAALANLGFEIR